MKKTILFTIGLVFITIFTTTAQTTIPSGTVAGTWTLAGSPYLIQGNVLVNNNTTLVIEPGVTINFQGTYKFNVQGKLLAIGTATDSITFIATNTTNGWKGIRFDNTLATNDTSRISYCIIKYAIATGTAPENYGGGMYFNNYGKVVVSNSKITLCKALRGAGIYFSGNNSNPVISGNMISYNTNNVDGGGALFCDNSCSPFIINNNITQNSAVGAGAFSGGITCSGGNPVITNNQITHNTTFMNGGGIACHGTNSVISNNTIAYNTASTFGGGVYFGTINNPVLSNNIITNNSAINGGGLFLTAATNVAIKNTVICNNSASADGGGIYSNSSSVPVLKNVTVTNNTAVNGGGMYCNGSTIPVFTSSIFYGNTASASGPEIFLFDEDSDPDFYYSNLQGGIAAIEANGNFYMGDFQNCINANPLFVAPSGGSGIGFDGVTANWSLQVGSPCIDAGDPTMNESSTDLAGLPRVNVCRIDMGAYEYQTGVPFQVSLSISDSIACYGSTGAIEAIVTSGTGPYSFLWSDGQTTATATGLIAGTYTVTITQTSDGCAYTKSINLPQNYTANMTPDLGSDISITCGGSHQFYVALTPTGMGSQTFTYQWFPSSGLDNNTSENPTTSTNIDTRYTVIVTSSGGCVKKDSVMVFVAPLSVNAGMNKSSICGGSVQFDGISTNYTGSGTLTYLWSPATGLDNVTVANPTATVTSNTTFFVTVTTPNGCTTIDSVKVFVSLLTANAGSDKNLVCGGSVQFDAVSTNYTGIGTLSYSWSPTIGLDNVTAPNPTATITSDTTYTVTVTTPNGCTAIDSIRVFSEPLTINTSDVSLICGDSVTLNTSTNYTGTDMLSYSWSPTVGLDNPNSANPKVSVIANQLFTVTVSTPNGCTATYDADVTVVAMNAPEICIVSVNSANKNSIVWNKEVSNAIDSFIVYRETNITDVYQIIGVVSYDSLSVFVDTNSFPDVQSNKYKIAIRDICGFESDMSSPHNTMHLSINQGTGTTWNLLWNAYEGLTVSTYNVYRGSDSESLLLIGTSSGSNTSYSDIGAPAGDVFYQVELVSSSFCNPTKSYNTSLSNISTNSLIGLHENSNSTDLIGIYPNPFSDQTTIQGSIMKGKKCVFNLYDMLGNAVMEKENGLADRVTISRNNLSSGIYTYVIKESSTHVVLGSGKIIIQ